MNPSFRRVEDVVRYLDEIKNEVSDLTNLSNKQQTALASLIQVNPKVKAVVSASEEFDVTPSVRTVRKEMKKTIDPNLDKVVIPNVSKLKDQYGVLRDLYQKHLAVEAAESQLELQFGDKKGPLYNQTMKSIKELKAKIAQTMRQTFAFISDVAEKHVPKTFRQFTEAVRNRISDHVMFEDSKSFLYVSVNKERQLVFTEYFMLIEATNDAGKITPHLYVVVQWTVGQRVEVYVEHEFSMPDDLTNGPVVGTVQQAVEAVSHLLTLEDFSSAIGNVPMSLALKNTKLDPANFKARDAISKITVDTEELSFTFRKGLTAEERKAAAYSIFQDMRSHLRQKRMKMKMEISSKGLLITLHNVAPDAQITNHDIAFMKEAFGLSDTALRKIENVINNDR